MCLKTPCEQQFQKRLSGYKTFHWSDLPNVQLSDLNSLIRHRTFHLYCISLLTFICPPLILYLNTEESSARYYFLPRYTHATLLFSHNVLPLPSSRSPQLCAAFSNGLFPPSIHDAFYFYSFYPLSLHFSQDRLPPTWAPWLRSSHLCYRANLGRRQGSPSSSVM